MAQRYLISRLSALGDVVCTLPVASALKKAFPDCRISWVVDPRFAGVVECCSAVDVVERAKPGFSPSSWPTFRDPFDVAFDMQGLMKSAIVIARAQAKRKLGYWWQREGARWFSTPVLPDKSSIHIVDQYVDVARAAGGEAERAEFSLRPKAEDIAAVRSKFSPLGEGSKFVVMNPGAGWATKRWKPEYFAEVAYSLRMQGVPTVLIGGPSTADKEVAQEVTAREPEALSLVGETSVRELVALISLSTAHLGGDTGSTHIAAALGVPAIGLYSITRPERSCPYGQFTRCLYNPEGLAFIQPNQVLAKLEEAFALT